MEQDNCDYDELYAIEELSCAAFGEMVKLSNLVGINDEVRGQVELVRAIQEEWMELYHTRVVGISFFPGSRSTAI